MFFSKKMRLSQVEKKEKEDEIYYIGSFLDELDNKYQFFIDKKLYDELSKKNKYDEVVLNLNLYFSNKGRYGLGVL